MTSTDIPIVFIHLGAAEPPSYARIAVEQARRWNPTARILFLADLPVTGGYGAGEEWVRVADIPVTKLSERFAHSNTLDMKFRGGFWRYTTERLFVLERWMRWTGEVAVFHLEYDNMLYMDVNAVVGGARDRLKALTCPALGLGEQDTMSVVFSVLFCKDVDALWRFLFTLTYPSDMDEMRRGGMYWSDEENEADCGAFPGAPAGAILQREWMRESIEDAAWPGVFDAAAHGQYLGGEDPRNGARGPGFVNESSEFRTDQFTYEWRRDEAGRRYPVLVTAGGAAVPIYNLHIHCKRLADFI